MNHVHLQEARLTTEEERKEKQDYLIYCSSHFILGLVENSCYLFFDITSFGQGYSAQLNDSIFQFLTNFHFSTFCYNKAPFSKENITQIKTCKVSGHPATSYRLFFIYSRLGTVNVIYIWKAGHTVQEAL